VHAQFGRVLDALEQKLPQVAGHLDAARGDILAFTAFPKAIWRQTWSSNPQERLNREMRRYIGLDVLASRLSPVQPAPARQEVPLTAITA
jgi:transposase-like protein